MTCEPQSHARGYSDCVMGRAAGAVSSWHMALPAHPDRAALVLRRLAQAGERVTSARTAIAQAIAARPRPFTAEDLATDLRAAGVGRATVYRTLAMLETQGVLARTHLDGAHRYSLCEEKHHHHHLVCTRCSAVAPVDASRVEREIQRLAAGLRFRVATHDLEFAGLCERCQAESG